MCLDAVLCAVQHAHTSGLSSQHPVRRLGLGLKPPRFKTAFLRHHVKGQVALEGDFVWQGDPELVLNLKPLPRKLGPATVVLQLLSGLVRLQVWVLSLPCCLQQLHRCSSGLALQLELRSVAGCTCA